MKLRYRYGLLLLGVLVAVIALLPLLRGPRRGRSPGKGSLESRPTLDLSQEGNAVSSLASLKSESIEVDSAWSRFRGPNGTGVSVEVDLPMEWGDEKNLKWKMPLAGPGASSPILTDEFVIVTSYSGYGEPDSNVKDIKNLKRHVQCFDRTTGDEQWSETVDALLPEDPYQGKGVPEHGYATNTPVTDGESIFVFFGKSGVHAYDMKGNHQWQTGVGTESSNREWGSAASLILYRDLLIVNASEESQTLYALDKKSGKVIWDASASTLELTYGTPAIMHVDEGRDDLVIAVPGEIWGLNPNTGKLVWYAQTNMTGNLSPSVIVDGMTVYAFGGFNSSGSMAIRGGGKGDVTKTHLLWSSRNSSYIATPVLLKNQLFWIDDKGLYYCTDASTGKLLNRTRIPGIDRSQRPVYASPIAIGDKIYAQSRLSGMFVLAATSDLKILAQNRFASDSSICNACPAVNQGQMFLRSDKYLYCISEK